MVIKEKSTIREISTEDKTQLANLIHFGTFVHRHLDWRPPLDWIGHKPFFGIETEGKLMAALSCAPAPPSIAWIRLLVISAHISQGTAWKRLWGETRQSLIDQDISILAAIPLQRWIKNLLRENEFENHTNVISFAIDNLNPARLPQAKPANIRPMKPEDLDEVALVDNHSFDPLWSNSQTLLSLAFEQSIYSTVAYDENGITGYQISTPAQYGGHLGRLAVLPRVQGQGIGYALLYDLQQRFSTEKDFRLSVNTQDNNKKSIALYKKGGFIQTSETFPVYQHNLN